MTTEEKARAYDEALEVMRQWIAPCHTKEQLDTLKKSVFPELSESEDEKIRKAICHVLNNVDYGIIDQTDYTVSEMEAYLEKQKEQKPVESISQLTVQGKGVYKICPRCKERMVRDDSMVYTSMPPQYRYECPKCGESECDTVMYDNPEMEEQKPEEKPINWTELTWKDINELEGIINNVHYEFRNGISEKSFGEEVLEKFREYKGDEYLDEIEQKPVDWDEYTKTNLDRALQIIKKAKGTLQGYQSDDGIYECDKAIECLEHFLYRGLEIEKHTECIEFANEFDNQVSHLLASVLNGEHEYNKDFVKYAAQSLLGYAKNELKPDEWSKREKLLMKALQTSNAQIGELVEENYKLKEQKPADLSEMMVHKEPYIAPVPTPMVADGQKLSATKNGKTIPPENYSVNIPLAEWSEEDETAFGDLMWCIERASKSAKDENDMGNIWFAENWVKNRLKSIRPNQPKQEWSEEDKEMINTLVDYVEYPSCWNLKCPREKLVTFIKSLPERFSPQPYQEWSEEDEKIAKEIEEELWYPGDFPDYPSKEESELYDDCQRRLDWFKNKLKSLRLQPKKELSIEKAIQWLDDTFYFLDNSSGRGRDCEITTHDFDSLEEMYDSFRKAVIVDSEPHWKPSEEQMEALLNAEGFLRAGLQHDSAKTIAELYEQLKKLM